MNQSRRLQQLLETISGELINERDPLITGITHDSRAVHPGNLFVAISGNHADGHDYIESAISAGAAAVLCRKVPAVTAQEVVYIKSSDTSRDMSRIAAAFYRTAEERMFIIGVTGTDGKSSTCDYIYQLLSAAGIRTALSSSVHRDTGRGVEKNRYHLTTPDAVRMHSFLAEASANGCTHAVIEASSHGLDPQFSRLADITFDIALCTNITAEHLDFHQTRERYIDAKMNIFRQLRRNTGIGIIPSVPVDWGGKAAAVIHSRNCSLRTWGSGDEFRPAAGAQLHVTWLAMQKTETAILIQTDSLALRTTVPFSFRTQLLNLAPALLVLTLIAPHPAALSQLLDGFRFVSVPGRYSLVTDKRDRILVIDFAHTPQAFSHLLSDMRRLYPDKRFTVVFGSAGQRDSQKRPHLGSVAAAYCSSIILTDEDPREESPDAILSDIAAGIPEEFAGTVIREPDRKLAIERALHDAGAGEVLLFLGKGHEESIEYGDNQLVWDEAACLQEILIKQGDM